MGMFKQLLNDIESGDPETTSLIKDAADFVYSQNMRSFDSDVFSESKVHTVEELIHGYMVTYQYKKAMAKLKNDGEREFIEVRVVSITNALTYEIIDDIAVSNMIEDTIVKKLKS